MRASATNGKGLAGSSSAARWSGGVASASWPLRILTTPSA